jgi:hypothetical protein
MDLADVADELYAVPPEDFIAERTAARDSAKAAGDKALAADIAALPKPSTAAWVCNLLVRRQREEIAQLVELGGLMRDAQANLSGDQLKELGKQRSQVVAALARQARALAAGEGHPVSTAIAEQVEETLRAAVADPDAGAALLGGQLTGALSYNGFGPVDLSGAVAPARPAHPARTPAKPAGRSSPAGGDRTAREQRRKEAEERARREAEEARRRELAQAEQDAEEAAAVARDTAAAVETAGQRVAETTARREELQARVAELQQELRRTEQRVTAATADLTEAEHRRDAAVRRAQTAASIRDRSQQRLERLRGDAAER